MRYPRLIALVALCATAVATGCAKRAPAVAQVEPPAAAAVEPPPPPPPPPPVPAPAPPPALTEEEIFARKTLAELNAERPLGDVFFNFDEFVIREDARPVLQRNAEWLQRWGSTRIMIEGHADERGTSEYNLALAERRANAAREYLSSLGISPDRIVGVSKGEESPFCTESHEGCWQQNRRGYFVITAK
jgi:peptidoglycan-associated lipoprotein